MLPKLDTARAAVRSRLERSPTLGRGVEFASAAVEIPARLARALAEVEALLARVGPLLDRMDELTERAAGVLDAADHAVGEATALNAEASATVYQANEVSLAARAVIDRAGGTAEGAEALFRRYAPIAGKAAPLAEKFVDSLSPGEVDAAIRFVDELPRLADHLRDDILPILATLERAGPDLSELVKVSYDMRRAILGIPGFGFFKKRGEEALADVEDEALLEDWPAPLATVEPVRPVEATVDKAKKAKKAKE